MKKTRILFFGDSITDMQSDKSPNSLKVFSLGMGYTFLVASAFSRIDPNKYEIINCGISGNTSVDLYARLKKDVWNLKPDVLSILVGVNDVWHRLEDDSGVDLDRFEKVYSMIIKETLKVLPDLKIMLMEPFVLKGSETVKNYDEFLTVKDYAKVVRSIAEKNNLYFVPLQETFDEYSAKYGAAAYLADGVHPEVAGATLIADEWMKTFHDKVETK